MTKDEVEHSFAHLDLPNAPVKAQAFSQWFHRLIGGEQHGYARIFLKLLIRTQTYAFYTCAVVDQLDPEEYKIFKEQFEKVRAHING